MPQLTEVDLVPSSTGAFGGRGDAAPPHCIPARPDLGLANQDTP
ncbi:hypothetical protein [Streptomyces clavuligerus]|nr:hypothetical protein [Streptomyces clavuligerus]EDY52983.1 hypothetical protein SSCG_06065 [Streptomyces clavuligerus]